jgi:hypothetical protein
MSYSAEPNVPFPPEKVKCPECEREFATLGWLRRHWARTCPATLAEARAEAAAEGWLA